MLKRIGNKVMRLANPINPSWSILLGSFTFAWGAWVIFPWWNAFDTAKLYGKMLEFAPEWAWGTWALIAGAILMYSSMRCNYKLLVQALSFIGWHWFTVSTLMWFGDWQNPGPITYTMTTIYTLFFYLNIKLNYIGIDPDTKINRFVLRILRHN